ncbi:hypothetical protein DCAR_0207962 [Daucus carota subsp. sativus]|uniref:Uncharacterized protein n=1 Tax=Daucus carota subsp. sativus TaxID=79200 RepID=A0A166E7U3_DAUCS|nr:hypothetical protein DCAR_0207962 [Daucus carota subsp. sativus]
MTFITSYFDHKHHHHNGSGHQKLLETPHKLIDAPPYSSIYLTSSGFEAPTRRKLLLKYECANRGNAHPGVKVDAENNIDAEAEDFIKLKHKNFLLACTDIQA